MTAFFDRPRPRWFNIPAHRPFAEDLAQGLYDALAPLGARVTRMPFTPERILDGIAQARSRA